MVIRYIINNNEDENEDVDDIVFKSFINFTFQKIIENLDEYKTQWNKMNKK